MKRFLMILALLLCMTVLCGCGALDAAELLQGNLDLVYRNSCSEEYLKAVGFTKEDARQQFASGIEAELTVFADYFDTDLTLCSQQTTEKIRSLYQTIYASAKYEVGEAAKTDGGYEVALTVYPIDILQKFNALDAPAFMDRWEQRYDKGEFDSMTDAQYEEAWVTAILDALNSRLSEIGYLEGETITVQIEKDRESGLYVIPEEDFSAIDALILAY